MKSVRSSDRLLHYVSINNNINMKSLDDQIDFHIKEVLLIIVT